MPGLQNGDDYRYHGTDDYSFVTRSDRSRDFARRRRFGNENDAQDPAMSQVCLPLRISRVGSSSRQGNSPYEDYYSPSRYMERRRSTSPQLDRSSRLSGAVRHALALCGELDEDDPYYRERTAINSPLNYYEDDEDDEYVIVLQKRRKRPQSGRSFHDKDEKRSQSRTRPFGLNEEEGSRWVERRQTPHSRGYADNTKEVTYTMPVTRKRDEDEEDIRESASYLATRKQFAVEDNVDIEKLKNKKYEYRTKGPNPYFSEAAVDSLDKKGNFAQAPMFVIKPRSHTIWEKMYVKFTCTVRGTPEPKVTWYHNMVAIDPSTLIPGTMRISNQFGVHTLEIFQASLDDSGTYRASAQNHKGEISSYATLIVRRYDGAKTGYYDVKSGYNLTKPTDFPDVEQLDIPDKVSEVLKNHNEEKEVLNSSEENRVHYSGKSVEVGDGKFESVLELRIPERKQSLEEKNLILDVQVKNEIKPVLITTKLFPACDDENNNSEISSGSIDVPCGATKELRREELSECLRHSIKADDSNVKPSESDKDLVVEEIHTIEVDRKI